MKEFPCRELAIIVKVFYATNQSSHRSEEIIFLLPLLEINEIFVNEAHLYSPIIRKSSYQPSIMADLRDVTLHFKQEITRGTSYCRE